MLAVTHTSSVTDDQIDHLGHMNVRYYGVNAHAATDAVLDALDGWPTGPHVVYDGYTRHHREQLAGTPLLVRSGILGASADGIRIHHELVPANAEALAAQGRELAALAQAYATPEHKEAVAAFLEKRPPVFR